MQAFTLYLDSVCPAYGNRAVWVMAGVLVRTAYSLGLHRDATGFGAQLSPFQAEMRRRLWWHVCFIDARTGDCEVARLMGLSESAFDTREPANVDDKDLYPEMQEIEKLQTSDETGVSKPFTNSTVCLVQCELWRMGRRVQDLVNTVDGAASVPAFPRSLPRWLVDRGLKVVEDARQALCTKYLNTSDPTSHLADLRDFTLATACIHLTSAHLLLTSDRAIFARRQETAVNGLDATPTSTNENISQSSATAEDEIQRNDTDKAFLDALSTLECINDLQSQSQSRWEWTLKPPRLLPWPPICELLAQLCTRRWGPTSERAWHVTRRAIDDPLIPEALRNGRSGIRHPALGLVNAVKKHRARELARLATLPPDVERMLLNLASAGTRGKWSVVEGEARFDTRDAHARLRLETALVESGGVGVEIDVSSLLDCAEAAGGTTRGLDGALAADWVHVAVRGGGYHGGSEGTDSSKDDLDLGVGTSDVSGISAQPGSLVWPFDSASMVDPAVAGGGSGEEDDDSGGDSYGVVGDNMDAMGWLGDLNLGVDWMPFQDFRGL
jgi:hypothetical protein